jgi:dihydropyrimidinase
VLEQTKETGGLVMVHAENGHAIDYLVKRALAEGNTDPIYHALTRPEEMEAEATGRADPLPSTRGRRLHRPRQLPRRRRGDHPRPGRGRARLRRDVHPVPVHVDRRPAQARLRGARYVCSPPLRDASNQPFMWDALRYDHLQIVSTDHCPFNDEQKRLGLGDFSKIPNGLAAIQHRLPMLWEHGVREGACR